MYCKKCGTEQKDGQKYCPKCGEPFLDENGKPYLKGIRKDLQDAKDKLASKADELTQQGKKLVEEKVQPQLTDKIDELKKVDWEGKKNDSLKTMEGFFSNADKLRKATMVVAVFAVLWFFVFNHGFSASWTWWLFAVVFVVAAFYKAESKDKVDEINKARWSLGLAVLLGLVFLFHSSSSNSFGGTEVDEINVKANNAQEEEVILKMAKIMGEIKSTLPQIEALYNAHRQFLAQGGNPNFSPAWGKWQDICDKLNRLWDEYIGLARKLDNGDEIIQEAKEKKRMMNKSFDEMFVPNY